VALRVVCFDANPRQLEGILIRPLDGIRRAHVVAADEGVVHVEPDRSNRDVRQMLDLRDDPDRTRLAEAAERRRDANRQHRVAFSGGVDGCCISPCG
jgi:hypothetical protein